MKHLTAVAVVLAMSTAAFAQNRKPEQAKPADPDGIIWVGNWDEAVKEAKARNVPIHFALHKDN